MRCGCDASITGGCHRIGIAGASGKLASGRASGSPNAKPVGGMPYALAYDMLIGRRASPFFLSALTPANRETIAQRLTHDAYHMGV